MKTTTVILAGLINLWVFSAEIPKNTGTVVSIKTGDRKKDERYNGRIHACLFENGKHDLLYIGTKHGGWYDGWIELTIKGKKVYEGKVPSMTYGGTIIDIGDVIDKQPKDNWDQHITKIKGMLK